MQEPSLDLRKKIKQASICIDSTLEFYKNPAILCSFGKDSLLLLWMIRNWIRPLPVIFFQLPWFSRKRAFAQQIIAEWELEVYSPPPVGFTICSNNGKSEVVYHYKIGQQTLQMPLGQQSLNLRPDWLCGINTLLKGPFGSQEWPWDVAFCGHKSSDIDPVRGNVPLQVSIHQMANACHLAYPLKDFTDEDVWECHRLYSLPENQLRYGTHAEPIQDNTESFWNEDYLPYCNKCFDPNNESFVQCPKTNLMMTNIHDSLAKSNPSFLYCSKKGG